VIINWTDPFVRATIGIMSSSDAAPLPRLGEVFFDVRGDTRSMRLSWYADTDIAVFSIWHGGRCTGTFRLPMDDLARMTEILQRGPQRRHGGSRPDYERGGYDPAGYADPAGYQPPGYQEAGYDEDWYDEVGSPAGGHVPGQDELTRAYPDRAGANPPSPGQDSAGYERSGGYADSAGYERSGGYADSAGYERSAGYADSAGYERSGGYADFPANAGFPADAGASDATGRYEFPARAVRPEDGSYLPGAAGHDGGAVTDLSSYGQQRFVPPYVRPGSEAYGNDNPVPGPPRGHGTGAPAYPADQAEYGRSDWQAADPGAAAQYSAGRHGGRRARPSSEAPFDEAELDAPGEPISQRDYWSRQAR
jgi:hypothetical protein